MQQSLPLSSTNTSEPVCHPTLRWRRHADDANDFQNKHTRLNSCSQGGAQFTHTHTHCFHGNITCHQWALGLLQSPNNMSLLCTVMISTVVNERGWYWLALFHIFTYCRDGVCTRPVASISECSALQCVQHSQPKEHISVAGRRCTCRRATEIGYVLCGALITVLSLLTRLKHFPILLFTRLILIHSGLR